MSLPSVSHRLSFQTEKQAVRDKDVQAVCRIECFSWASFPVFFFSKNAFSKNIYNFIAVHSKVRRLFVIHYRTLCSFLGFKSTICHQTTKLHLFKTILSRLDCSSLVQLFLLFGLLYSIILHS